MEEENDKLFMIPENEHVALKARQQQGYLDHLDGMLFDRNQWKQLYLGSEISRASCAKHIVVKWKS